jgi:competence protein ComFC
MADVLPRMGGLKRAALDLLFPRFCLGCGKEGSYICTACRETLPVIVPPSCPHCGRPVPGGGECGRCRGDEKSIDGIRAPFIFEGVIRRAVHELKYNNLRDLAPDLAALLHAYVRSNSVPGEVYVPVPLHPRRLRERGYNQSALLARELGRLDGVAVEEGCLVRTVFRPPQVRTASVEERRRNVAGAFACRDRRLAGKRVVLIDDVLTSGATLGAGAGALKAAGVVSVWGLTVALEE